MRRILNYLPLWLLALMLTGCATQITNLTPSHMPRNATGMYPFAVIWDTSQQSVRKETVRASVQVGLATYPLESTPMVKNRWEGLVPVPADQDPVHYRYKFDYEYLGMPHRKQNSDLSPTYQLRLTEK